MGGSRGGVYTWDTNTGVEYRQYDGGHDGGAVSTTMCYPMEDGSHVIITCGGSSHTIVAWDLETTGEDARGDSLFFKGSFEGCQMIAEQMLVHISRSTYQHQSG